MIRLLRSLRRVSRFVGVGLAGSSGARLSAAAAAVVCLLGGEVQAAPRVPTRLVWDGALCGDAEGFAERVMLRSSAVQFVPRGERVLVRLAIEQQGTGLAARVRIDARGRQPVVRRIASPDCDDALDALALVVAISIEGRPSRPAPRRARRGRRQPPRSGESAASPLIGEPGASAPSPPPSEAPAAAPAASPPAARAATEAIAPSPPEAVATPPAAAPEPAPPAPTLPVAPLGDPAVPRDSTLQVDAAGARRAPADDTRATWVLRVGLAAQSLLGVAPQPLFGGSLWVSAERPGADLWSPLLTASVMHQRRSGLTRAQGTVDFTLDAAGLGFCPLRLGSRLLHFRPCALGSFGRLEVRGRRTFDPRVERRPWAAAGATLELVSSLEPLELSASLGGLAPLVRDGFRFGGPCSGAACELGVFHHVTPVVWSGAVGVGVSFW